MLARYLTSAAVAAALMIPATAASAASKNSTVTLKLRVNPIIMLFVTDNQNDDGTSGAGNIQEVSVVDQDGSTLHNEIDDGQTGTHSDNDDFRAEFWVVANTTYDVNLTPGATFDGDEGAGVRTYAKFSGVTTATNYIGGDIFLDRDLTDPGTTVTAASVTDGEVDYSHGSRGIKKYGVGADFDIEVWGNASGLNPDDDADLITENGQGSIAPEDDYTGTVTVTVTTS